MEQTYSAKNDIMSKKIKEFSNVSTNSLNTQRDQVSRPSMGTLKKSVTEIHLTDEIKDIVKSSSVISMKTPDPKAADNQEITPDSEVQETGTNLEKRDEPIDPESYIQKTNQTILETANVQHKKEGEVKDEIEELFKTDDLHQFDVDEPLDLRTGRKGICFEIAENPDRICRKGICQPSPAFKEVKSETGKDYSVTKKICRRENLGLLTCLNRPGANEKKSVVEEIDVSRCKTLIETTLFKASTEEKEGSKSLLESEGKNGEGTEDKSGEGTVDKNGKRTEGENGEGTEEKNGEGTDDQHGIEDTAAEGVDIELLGVDEIKDVAEVCECCHCAVCRCKPKYVKRQLTESQVELRRLRALQLGLARERLTMVYSWDTIKVPSKWDFQKDQEMIRKIEMEAMLEEAEKLERERLEALAALEAEGEQEEEVEEEVAGTEGDRKEIRRRRETEKDWARYKAMEWAGLREEYTHPVKTLKLDSLDDLSNVSWTSQPLPQLLIGTAETKTKSSKSSSTATTYLGPIEERDKSFVKVTHKGVKLDVRQTEKEMERKRRQIQGEDKRKEIEAKRMREVGKKAKVSESLPELYPVDSLLEADTSSMQLEHRPENYDSYIDVHDGKKKKIVKKKPSKMASKEIDENRLPMGLRREAQKLKKRGPSRTEIPEKKSKLKTFKALPEHAAARLAALQDLDSDVRATQSCPCLPGFCTCEGDGHWTFKTEADRYLLGRKKGGKTDDERTESELKAAGVYIWPDDECPCSHSFEDIHPTPEGSGDFVEAESTDDKRKIRHDEYICSCTKRYGQTVLIVKPDAMIFEDVIRRALTYVGGLDIINERKIILSPEQVAEVYSDKYYGGQSYPLFVLKMSRNPVLVLSVAGLRVMDVIDSMIGENRYIPDSWFLPESIKRRIVSSGDLGDSFHISDDAEQAAVESRYFFPNFLVEPIATVPSRINDFCNKNLNPTLSKGLAAVARTKPLDPILFLAEWLLTHNPYQPWYNPQNINMVPI